MCPLRFDCRGSRKGSLGFRKRRVLGLELALDRREYAHGTAEGRLVVRGHHAGVPGGWVRGSRSVERVDVPTIETVAG
jgi:hypothetical protein